MDIGKAINILTIKNCYMENNKETRAGISRQEFLQYTAGAGVMDTSWDEPPKLVSTDKGGYEWQEGATKIGEALVKGIEPRINAEHALHVLEIIEAARKSQETGTRIKLKSKFPWPMV
jgi:predicted dehydrogenase